MTLVQLVLLGYQMSLAGCYFTNPCSGVCLSARTMPAPPHLYNATIFSGIFSELPPILPPKSEHKSGRSPRRHFGWEQMKPCELSAASLVLWIPLSWSWCHGDPQHPWLDWCYKPGGRGGQDLSETDCPVPERTPWWSFFQNSSEVNSEGGPPPSPIFSPQILRPSVQIQPQVAGCESYPSL